MPEAFLACYNKRVSFVMSFVYRGHDNVPISGNAGSEYVALGRVLGYNPDYRVPRTYTQSAHRRAVDSSHRRLRDDLARMRRATRWSADVSPAHRRDVALAIQYLRRRDRYMTREYYPVWRPGHRATVDY